MNWGFWGGGTGTVLIFCDVVAICIALVIIFKRKKK